MLAIGNWKLHHTPTETQRFFSDWRECTLPAEVGVRFAVPYTSIHPAVRETQGTAVRIGAQDCSAYHRGAYTGDVAADMLQDAGASFVLVGHSERRAAGDTESVVRQKVAQAAGAGLAVVLCCGEDREQHRDGRTLEVLEQQIRSALEGVDALRLVVAYEPIWAIGTGEAADPEHVNATLQALRERLPHLLEQVPFLYGGSVQPQNVAQYVQQEQVHGVLVGGASTKAHTFAELVRSMALTIQ